MADIDDKQVVETGADTGGVATGSEAPVSPAEPVAKDAPAAKAAGDVKPTMRELIKTSVTALKDKMPGDKPRAQDGKFTKTGETAPATGAAAKPLDPSNPIATAAAPQAQTSGAPANWSAEAKAQYASLHPAVQKEIARLDNERSTAIGRAQKESADLKKNYGNLDQIFQAHQPRLAVRGESPAQGAARLLAMEAEFDRNPAYVIQELARQKGIDLTRLSTPQSGAVNRNDLDPHVLQLEDRLKGIEGQFTAQQQAELEGKKRQATSVVQEFENAKDDKGNLVNPHYAKLDATRLTERVLGLRLANPDRPMQDVLKEAYDAEIWATPTIRQELLAAQELAAEEKRKQDAATRVEAARKASGGTVRGTAGATPPAKPTIRGIIQNTFQALQNQ